MSSPRLLLTPPPLKTESLPGYVLHLTEVNGYDGTNDILSWMRKRPHQGSMERFDGAPLAGIAGLNADQIAGLTMVHPVHSSKHWVCVAGHPILSSHVRLNHPKVCPECLAETGRCESFWELSLAITCPRHQRRLIERCGQCGEQVRWSRAKACECLCGADYRQMRSSEPVSDAEVALMQAIRSGLYGMQDRWPDSLNTLAPLGVAGLLELIGVLCAKLGDGPENQDRRSFFRLAGQLPHVARMLADWPSSVQSYLEARYRLGEREVLPTPLSLFAWMRVKETSPVIAESGLEREVLAYLARHWHPAALERLAGPALPALDAFRWGDLADVRSVSGLHHATVKLAIAKGMIPWRLVERSRGKTAMIYSLEWARSAARTRADQIDLRDAAKLSGLTPAVLRALRADGTCRSIETSGVEQSLLCVADLRDLGDRLKSRVQANPMPDGSNPRTLKHLIRSHRRCVTDKAFLIRAILDGSLPVWQGESDWMGDLIVCSDMAAECVTRLGPKAQAFNLR